MTVYKRYTCGLPYGWPQVKTVDEALYKHATCWRAEVNLCWNRLVTRSEALEREKTRIKRVRLRLRTACD